MSSSTIAQQFAKILVFSFASLAALHAYAGEPRTLASQVALERSAADATDLKFREFFKMPIGPRGLEASEKLLSLVGKRVRIVGHMARQGTPTAGFFILAALPVTLGDEDDSLSDDMPASALFIHLDTEGQLPASAPVPYYPGLLRLTGILSLGPYEESDGHVSTVRLQLDPELVTQLLAKPGNQKSAALQSELAVGVSNKGVH
ncbi:hypothetical protein [Undibacterium parvum]|uniref:hypothetical protein n=1 Tax=Undibacterium parvum TaxID=401471 RepID=UPI001D1316C8|nr:hypothetical protein [Undibacterium parvum]